MESSFSWEALSPSLSICVSRAHRFGTDAFLLADFAAPRRKDLCCDLGCGCGIIPLLWFRDEPPRLCCGVDIQPLAIEQLQKTVEKNGLQKRLSCQNAQKIARHEVCCTIEDVCQAASRLLRFGGRLCLCQRPERLCDTLVAMRAAGIEPKRLRFVQQRPDKAPWLFLVEGKKGSKPFMAVEPPLLIEGEGGFSREVLDIYHKEENL